MKFPGLIKNLFLLWILFNLIPNKLNAVNLTIKIYTPVLLFAVNEYYYIVDSDYVYISKNEKNWIKKDNPFKGIRIEGLKFIAGKDFGYVFHSSGGDVFHIKDTTITPVFKSKYELRSHYKSTPFLIGNELNLFGGYGLFEFRNDIIYFDAKKKEWEKKIPLNSESKSPPRRRDHFALADSSDLYIGGGISINPENEASYLNTEKANDAWKFNFNDNRWEKLGTLKKIYDPDNYFHIPHKDEILFIYKKNDSYGIDLIFLNLKENKQKGYKQKNAGYLSDIERDNGRGIIYNQFTQKYLLLIDKENNYSTPIFLSDEDLLGEKTYEGKAYTPILIYRNLIWVFVAIVFITIFIYSFNVSSK